jgi:hypothetical protein
MCCFSLRERKPTVPLVGGIRICEIGFSIEKFYFYQCDGRPDYPATNVNQMADWKYKGVTTFLLIGGMHTYEESGNQAFEPAGVGYRFGNDDISS